MYKNLREFLGLLENEGELARIKVPVDPVFEIAEITDRVSKTAGGGKALLFESTGTAFPVVTNILGSSRRMAMALGTDSLDSIGPRIGNIAAKAMGPSAGFWDKLKMLPMLSEMSRWLPRPVSGRGKCQEIILRGKDVDLSILPVLKCWPHDGGRFITLPLVHTEDPDTGVRNVGMYRMQITGERSTGMHWHMHKTGARHYRGYKEQGRIMPVTVTLGGDPVYTYCATAPMPDNIDEYLLAGFLREKPVKLVKSLTNDIYIPADSDFVIEGYVDPSQEMFTEGPFGDHTGFYSLEDLYPAFHVTAITHRRDAIYPATVVGIPPQEDAYIAEATEKIFLEPIRLAMQPEIRDMWMPPAGVAHNLAILSIKTEYPGQAFKVASSMWGAGQMMFNKFMIVTTDNTDIRNVSELSRLIRNSNPGTDILFSRGVLDVLDHATATPGQGGKIALDLTTGGPQKIIDLSGLEAGPDGYSADNSLAYDWSIIILRLSIDTKIDYDLINNYYRDSGISYIIVCDEATSSLKANELLWYAAGNTDPGRDILLIGDKLIIDARSKADKKKGHPSRWPEPVVSSRTTISRVNDRWKEYGLDDKLTSPSLRYGGLVQGDKAEV